MDTKFLVFGLLYLLKLKFGDSDHQTKQKTLLENMYIEEMTGTSLPTKLQTFLHFSKTYVIKHKIFGMNAMNALDGVEPELTGVVKIVWTAIRPQLEANRRKYENGKKGGAPKGSRNNPAGRRGKTEVMPETNRELTIGISNPEGSFRAPSLKEVQEFIISSGAMVDAQRFIIYYEGKKWQHNGEYIDWRNKIQSWDYEERKRQGLVKGVNVLGVGEFFDKDGNRRYSTTGPVIPSDAPARPSVGHWWNTITKEWCLVA